MIQLNFNNDKKKRKSKRPENSLSITKLGAHQPRRKTKSKSELFTHAQGIKAQKREYRDFDTNG